MDREVEDGLIYKEIGEKNRINQNFNTASC